MAKKSVTPTESQQAAIALQALFASKYIDKKKLYWENFMRGFAFSIGGVLGATIGIALIMWGLSLFNEVPFLGEISKKIQYTIEQVDTEQIPKP